NGNNGLDIFEGTGDLSVSDGLLYENGVDGLFICGNGTGPKISRIKTRNNLRIGILAYGRSSAPVGFNITDCECINDGLYNICMTGVRSGDVRGNTLGGAKEAIKVEGRNGLLNPSGITIDSNVFTLESTDNDINANIGGYTDGGESGAISVLNNRYNGRNPKHTCRSHELHFQLYRSSRSNNQRPAGILQAKCDEQYRCAWRSGGNPDLF
ncbi:hypothetical protein, partial [Klebsiella michiganensis]|uniref:hypothetical protein n=1 Tax=Klebsiella michiganensis TaxID=1134687 RepID=UPI001F153D9F